MKHSINKFYKGISCLSFSMLGLLSVSETTLAQTMNNDTPDLSGFWELPLGSHVIPEASLLDSITPTQMEQIAKHDARAIRWCNMLGVPYIMTQRNRPLEIWAGSNHVAIVAMTKHASPRYAYLDMTDHIDPLIYEPSSTGQSIAYWQEDTLVVDTIGFSGEKGGLAIPGGGFRTETSHLVERFRLINENTLSVVSTWTDENVFAAPHTYEYRYQRLPADYTAPAFMGCDSTDQERTQFLEAAWGGAGSLD